MFLLGGSLGIFSSFFGAMILTMVVILGITITFIVSKILSNTVLKGESSHFVLELPPYRKPQILKTIIRTIFDKTIFILGRAVAVSIPSGVVIWCLANIYVQDVSILGHITQFLDPIGSLLGLDGVILMAFIVGIPANEIVLPIIIMAYLGTTTLTEMNDLASLKELLINNGWSIKTAICTILFATFHWPCATTCLTIKQETKSNKWTMWSFILPTLAGTLMCMFVNFIFIIFEKLL